MDIETRIRAVLGGVTFSGGVGGLMVGRVRGERFALPTGVGGSSPSLGRGRGELYNALALTGMLRMVRAEEVGVMREALDWYEAEARRKLPGAMSIVEALWGHWILVLGEKTLRRDVGDGLLEGLWERGFGEQGEAGHLHPLTAETLMEGFVYDELAGIHAAYNAAKVMGDAGMMEQVRRVVRWHVKNTQPDNTTNEPWGLAAFAALDETGTFAEQQLQDAVVQLRNGVGVEGRVPVSVGLLADAVMTLENG